LGHAGGEFRIQKKFNCFGGKIFGLIGEGAEFAVFAG
jgi:hypothetical protein